jgi:thiol-disulfide isomerase/thioredoxin
MLAMTKTARVLFLGAILFSISAADRPAECTTLKVVKYDKLTEAVRQLRGNVVIVDFWADFCVPCKREFPRLVELHRKHATAGLSAVSVALDENDDAHRQSVNRFLGKQNAVFANYLLDEKPCVWQTKLKIDGPPLVFVFNRKGELVQRFADAEVDYDKIAALVAKLLKE